MVSILDFGAKPDGKTLATKALQAAIDHCAAEGGGTVLVPAGKFVCGTIQMRSHVHIHLEGGATILASTDFEHDYLPREEVTYQKFQDMSHSYFDHSLFLGRDCEDIGFSGHGTIDMQGVWTDKEHGEYNRTVKVMAMRECRDIIIEGITVLRATDLGLYFAGCERVRIYGISMRVLVDGISPDGCRDFIIADSYIECGDDAIVLKASYTLNRLAACENLTITGCVVMSLASAIKLGTETNGDFRNITITGCVIKNTERAGIAIESVDGAHVEGINISNITMRNVGCPIFLRLGKRMRAPADMVPGTMKNIMISNVYADSPHETYSIIPYRKAWETEMWTERTLTDEWTSQILGLSEQPIENLTLRDVHIVSYGDSKPENTVQPPLEEHETMYPEVTMYGFHKSLPAHGMVMRHVKGVYFDHCVFETRNPDVRPAIFTEYVEDFTQK